MSRIATVHLRALPLEVAFDDPWTSPEEDRPSAKAPCAVRLEVRGRGILHAVSAPARKVGVRPGMSQGEGKATLPALAVRVHDPVAQHDALQRAAELLFAFGPTVEVTAPDLLFVEVGRSLSALARKFPGCRDEAALARVIQVTLQKAGHAATVVIARDADTGRTLAQAMSHEAWPRVSSGPRIRGRGRNRGPSRRARRAPAPRASDTTRVVPPGAEAESLASLPLAALVWTDLRQDPEGVLREQLTAARASLELLGVRTVGRLSELPAAQLALRFGEAGALLAARAQAARERPLDAFEPPEHLVEHVELEGVTEDLEPILFVLKRLMSRLAARLEARSRAVVEVRLRFVVEPGLDRAVDVNEPRPRNSQREEVVTLRFARATRQARTLLNLAREKLEGSLPGAVGALSVEAYAPEVDHGAQLDLFNAHASRVEDVGELVSRLKVSLGDHAVFCPQLRDTHRPERAWERAPFDIERALAGPREERASTTRFEALSGGTLSRSDDPSNYRLPEVDARLRVTGDPACSPGGDACSGVEKRSWPKPVPREPEDEPVPTLPPRPLSLFEAPESGLLLGKSGMDEGILIWRKERVPLVGLGGRERLEAEWWKKTPLVRDYAVAEAADGRRFWLYFDACGEVHVHGVFD